MGQYVDISNEILELARNASKENRSEFSIELKNRYLIAFKTLRAQLENSYINNRQYSSIRDRQTIAEQARDAMIQAYRSSRGNADILNKKDLEEYIKKQQILLDRLKALRDNFYMVEDINRYKQLALQMMALTYGLRRDLNEGREEHFAFIYKGSGGFAEYYDIPVTEFLTNINIINSISLQYGSIASWTGGIDQSLRFDYSIGEQLRKNFNNSSKPLTDTFMYERQALIKETREYKTERGMLQRLDTLTNLLATNIKVYREDNGYWVVESGAFQRGFVDQGLFGEAMGDRNYTFEGDTRPWYEAPDITGKDGAEYSVKSLLGGMPSLVSYNSLYDVSQKIINVLENFGNNVKGAAQELRQAVFKIDSMVNKEVKETLDIIPT